MKWKSVLKLLAGGILMNVVLFLCVFRRPVTGWKRTTYDCAVVCGYFTDKDGKPSAMMKSRVDKAVELWKKKKVQYLIMSGAAVYNQYIEAEAMKRYAMDQGIPENCIVEEKQAVSTYHNMMYSKALMTQTGAENCVVVTNGWHLRKAAHYAAGQHLDYVVCRCADPPGQSLLEKAGFYVKTAVNMYINLFKGYY